MKLRLAKKSYAFWTDAKFAAREKSLVHGVAWIIGSNSPFFVAYSDRVENAPDSTQSEFIDGVEQ